jgi:hypothetical protein
VSAPGSRAVVRKTDVDTAQAVLDAWLDHLGPSAADTARAPALPYLRGLVTQALADMHSQGYDQGVVHGRRLVARTVRDALDGEGL